MIHHPSPVLAVLYVLAAACTSPIVVYTPPPIEGSMSEILSVQERAGPRTLYVLRPESPFRAELPSVAHLEAYFFDWELERYGLLEGLLPESPDGLPVPPVRAAFEADFRDGTLEDWRPLLSPDPNLRLPLQDVCDGRTYGSILLSEGPSVASGVVVPRVQDPIALTGAGELIRFNGSGPTSVSVPPVNQPFAIALDGEQVLWIAGQEDQTQIYSYDSVTGWDMRLAWPRVRLMAASVSQTAGVVILDGECRLFRVLTSTVQFMGRLPWTDCTGRESMVWNGETIWVANHETVYAVRDGSAVNELTLPALGRPISLTALKSSDVVFASDGLQLLKRGPSGAFSSVGSFSATGVSLLGTLEDRVVGLSSLGYFTEVAIDPLKVCPPHSIALMGSVFWAEGDGFGAAVGEANGELSAVIIR